MKSNLDETLTFPCGIKMKNRFALAPMTTTQSNSDATITKGEIKWLEMRAKGEFGMVITCASHVQKIGQGFPNQLGIFKNDHIDGHKKLVEKIQKHNSLAIIQLHHAGMRSPQDLIDEQPVCPSENKENNARALTLEEVKALRKDFIEAAIRSKKAGYDGVEIHGAHGYIINQFLSNVINKRTDKYGGNLANRTRLLYEIIEGIRNHCGAQFIVGVRLSPERSEVELDEVKTICKQLVAGGKIDFLDISLWDSFKMPEDEKYKNKPLLSHFTELDYKNVLLTVAGNIRTAEDVSKIINSGVDFVSIGRAAILHYNFPEEVINNSTFKPIELPVSENYLKEQGLSKKFITYMKRWPNFVG